MNIESCQPEGENKLLRVDNLMYTSCEGSNCLIIWKLLLDDRENSIMNWPLHFICLGCLPCCLPRHELFPKTC